jgi:signal transduction histidine kinase
MNISLTLKQKAFILVGLPLIFELLFIGYLFHLLNEAEREVQRQWHARAVVDCCNGIMIDVYNSRGEFVSRRIPGAAQIRHIERHIVPSLMARVDKLLELVKDKPDEYQAALALKSVCNSDIQILLELKESILEDPLNTKARLKKAKPRLSNTTDTVSESIAFILYNERRIDQASPQIQSSLRDQSRKVLWLAVIVNGFLALALAAYFNRGSAQRLSRVVDNTRKLEKGLPLNPPLQGTDEIAAVDEALRRAAHSIEEARRKERFLLDNLPVAILVIDKENIVRSANPAAEDLFEESSELITGRGVLDLLGLKEDSYLLPGPVKELRLNLPNSNSKRSAELLVREFDDFRLLAMIDVTEKLAAQKLRQQFVAMVSHDLRTPLTSVQASLELVASGSFGRLSETGMQQLGRAERSLERLIKLINDLLDSERVESGTFVVDRRSTSLLQVVDRAIECIRESAAAADITVKNKVVDLSCFIDEDRIVQVLVNLLGNAIKFSPSGSTIVIETQTTRDFVKVRVVDQGRGIPQDMLPHVFEKFMQVDKSDGTRGKGFGLGLSICKSIVDQHGGKIGVYSEEGQGATFWFSLPLSKSL